MDFNEYLEIFLEESKEHLQSINDELLKLESEPDNTSIVNEIFRSAHTLKGMAGSMGFEDLASLTHQMENVLDLLRNGKININSDIMDIIFKCVDLIEKMVVSIENGGDGKENVTEVVNELARIKDGTPAKSTPTAQVVEEVKEEQQQEPKLPLDEFVISLIGEARKMGSFSYQIKVSFDENCLMKNVRAYMVIQAAEELGEIVQTNPASEQIETEDFGDSFVMILISPNPAQEVQSQLANVMEVKEVLLMDRTDEEHPVLEVAAAIEAVAEPEVTVTAEAVGAVNVTESVQALDDTQTSVTEQANQPKVKTEAEQKHKKVRTKSIRVDIEKLDHLMNLFSELIIDRGRLEQISRRAEIGDLTETVEHMARISTDLQGLILNMRMVPVDQVFNRFPRMVRDLAKELNKKVNLEIVGAETELDRTVIDEIGDPLVHLLRNALDHGLEITDERIAKNKPEEGKILLKAYHGGNHVFIEVSDDGHGINREKILKKAIEKAIITAEEGKTLSDQQVYHLLFASGFSTAEKVSDISGRGVGLDVVKTKIESLGGVITIDSTPGQGSTFRVQLPLTLSIIYSMLVKVEDETYAIPFSSIVEITTLQPEQVATLHGKRVFQFRGQVVPLIYLNEVFQVPPLEDAIEKEQIFIVIVRKGTQTVGLVVDSVLGQQEVVLKSLGGFLTNLYAISGATILGNGEVALIIDSNQFIN
ncbi:chemotaxis protein CheA [Bacillus sp. DNRA2]|uniref:chemotaxis protein CheA n=1 Tax=Bacillus sp. DNRA2 TaxID=2723053 RepID=UPI00145CA5FF|nr:chemotaxis protein CheA [Bacillus sp. DNRA2]NMD69120.1 chemotaxis protein CheA [Bacillus sp. DNRA2]